MGTIWLVDMGVALLAKMAEGMTSPLEEEVPRWLGVVLCARTRLELTMSPDSQGPSIEGLIRPRLGHRIKGLAEVAMCVSGTFIGCLHCTKLFFVPICRALCDVTLISLLCGLFAFVVLVCSMVCWMRISRWCSCVVLDDICCCWRCCCWRCFFLASFCVCPFCTFLVLVPCVGGGSGGRYLSIDGGGGGGSSYVDGFDIVIANEQGSDSGPGGMSDSHYEPGIAVAGLGLNDDGLHVGGDGLVIIIVE